MSVLRRGAPPTTGARARGGELLVQLRLPMLVAVLGWAASRAGMSLLAVLAVTYLVVFVTTHWQRFTEQIRAGAGATQSREESPTRLRQELAWATAELAEARRRAHASSAGLRAAADLAVRMEENVRAVIVADLHDTTTQSLVAAAYASYDEQVPRSRLTELMQEAERELRTVMLDQSPLREEDGTLADLIASLVRRMRQRHRLTVDVTWPEASSELLYPEALVTYRFIHEALTNVAKHAGVASAAVALEVDDDAVSVTVSDAGAGFDPSDPGVENRLGLGLLRRRCAIVGGTVSVDAAPGAGTRIVLRYPRLAEPDPG